MPNYLRSASQATPFSSPSRSKILLPHRTRHSCAASQLANCGQSTSDPEQSHIKINPAASSIGKIVAVGKTGVIDAVQLGSGVMLGVLLGSGLGVGVHVGAIVLAAVSDGVSVISAAVSNLAGAAGELLLAVSPNHTTPTAAAVARTIHTPNSPVSSQETRLLI